MTLEEFPSGRQPQLRTALRRSGLAVLGLGALLTAVGVGSFFASVGHFGPPRYFWCAFLGMPLLFLGTVLTLFGYLGGIQRYVAGETAPVAKDVVNYLGQNTQPGVKAVAKAVTEGITEGLRQEKQSEP